MSTARIVVPTIALSAGGVAAYLARGSDATPSPAAAAQLPTVDVSETRARQSGTLSLARRSIADVNMVENGSDNQAPKRGNSVSVVRYGVSGSTTTQK